MVDAYELAGVTKPRYREERTAQRPVSSSVTIEEPPSQLEEYKKKYPNYTVKDDGGKIILSAPEEEYYQYFWSPNPNASTKSKYSPRVITFNSSGRIISDVEQGIIRTYGERHISGRVAAKKEMFYDNGQFSKGAEYAFIEQQGQSGVSKIKDITPDEVITYAPDTYLGYNTPGNKTPQIGKDGKPIRQKDEAEFNYQQRVKREEQRIKGIADQQKVNFAVRQQTKSMQNKYDIAVRANETFRKQAVMRYAEAIQQKQLNAQRAKNYTTYGGYALGSVAGERYAAGMKTQQDKSKQSWGSGFVSGYTEMPASYGRGFLKIVNPTNYPREVGGQPKEAKTFNDVIGLSKWKPYQSFIKKTEKYYTSDNIYKDPDVRTFLGVTTLGVWGGAFPRVGRIIYGAAIGKQGYDTLRKPSAENIGRSAFILTPLAWNYGKRFTKSGQAKNILRKINKEPIPTLEGEQFYSYGKQSQSLKADKILTKPSGTAVVKEGLTTSKYTQLIAKPTVSVVRGQGTNIKYNLLNSGGKQFNTIKYMYKGKPYYVRSVTGQRGLTVSKIYKGDTLLDTVFNKGNNDLFKFTAPQTVSSNKDVLSMPELQKEFTKTTSASEAVSARKGINVFGKRTQSINDAIVTSTQKPALNLRSDKAGQLSYVELVKTKYKYIDFTPKQKPYRVTVDDRGVIIQRPPISQTNQLLNIKDKFTVTFPKIKPNKPFISITRKIPGSDFTNYGKSNIRKLATPDVRISQSDKAITGKDAMDKYIELTGQKDRAVSQMFVNQDRNAFDFDSEVLVQRPKASVSTGDIRFKNPFPIVSATSGLTIIPLYGKPTTANVFDKLKPSYSVRNIPTNKQSINSFQMPRLNVSNDIVQSMKPMNISDIVSRQNNLIKSQTRQIQQPRIIQQIRQNQQQQQRQTQQQQQRQQQKTRQISRLITINSFSKDIQKILRNTTPPPTRFNFDFKTDRSLGKGFSVSVKSGGKWKKLADGLTLRAAKATGARKVQSSLAASFMIGESNRAATKDIRALPMGFNKAFRDYKIKGGKIIKTPGLYIQKTTQEGGLKGGRLRSRKEVKDIQRKKKKKSIWDDLEI